MGYIHDAHSVAVATRVFDIVWRLKQKLSEYICELGCDYEDIVDELNDIVEILSRQ